MFDLVEGGAVVRSEPLLPVSWHGRRLRYEYNQGLSISPWFKRKEVAKPDFHPIVQRLETTVKFQILSSTKTKESHTVIDMPLDEAKKAAKAYIDLEHNILVKQFTRGASDAVEKGWAEQSTELLAYDSYTGEPEDLPALIPFIANKAAVLGRTIDEQVTRIRAKKSLFAAVCGKADALREQYDDSIDLAPNVSQIVDVFTMAKTNTNAFLAELSNG